MTSDQDWVQEKERLIEGTGNLADAIPGPLASEFVALAAVLTNEPTVLGVLQRVVDAAKAVVPGADLVSVTIRSTGGGFRTPVQTDVLATKLDQLQYELGEGPCVETTVDPSALVSYSGDLGSGREYPRFGPDAAGLGVHCLMAVGLFPQGGGPRMGALNLYSVTPHGLDERDRDIALVLAAHASTALAANLAVSDAEVELAQLREALRSRDVIGQAKGILMERRGISEDEAFDVLRRASQSLNVKLAQVAKTLVERRAEL